MTKEHTPLPRDPRIEAAIAELEELVRSRYPTAAFSVEQAVDEPEAVHILTTVDLDDPDEVVDLVIDRELALQIDEGLPIHVIPVRTPERVAALRKQQRYGNRPSPQSPVSPPNP